jgi:hypothetical protein
MIKFKFLLIICFITQIKLNAQQNTQSEKLYDQILRAQGSSIQIENDVLYKSMLKANEERRLERINSKYKSEQYRKYIDLKKGIPNSKDEVKYYYSKYDLASGNLTEYLLLIDKFFGKYLFYTFEKIDMANPEQNLIIFLGEGKYINNSFEKFSLVDSYSKIGKLNFSFLDSNKNFIQISSNEVYNVFYRVPFFISDSSGILAAKAESMKTFNSIFRNEKDRIEKNKLYYRENLSYKHGLKVGNYFHGGIIYELQNNLVKIVSLFDQCSSCINDYRTNNSIIFNHSEFYDDSAKIYFDWKLPTKNDLIKIKKNTNLLMIGEYWTSEKNSNISWNYFNPLSNVENYSPYPLIDKKKIRAIRIEDLKSKSGSLNNIKSIISSDNIESFYHNEDKISDLYWKGIDSLYKITPNQSKISIKEKILNNE